jgi:hypothetical protein
MIYFGREDNVAVLRQLYCGLRQVCERTGDSSEIMTCRKWPASIDLTRSTFHRINHMSIARSLG